MTTLISSPAIENIIAVSLDLLRQRLAQIPLSASAIEGIYGLSSDLAADLAAQYPAPISGDAELASVVFTFSCASTAWACHQVADMLSGMPGLVRLTLYVRTGVIGHYTIQCMPHEIGVINSVPIGNDYVFRLPLEGQEQAFANGEQVETLLWRCNREAVDLINQAQYRGQFTRWLADHATPWVCGDGLPYPVIHAECGLRLTAERIHALANLPEVSAIVSLEGNSAFK